MSKILNIETSGQLCSVALAIEGRVVAFREDSDGKSHAVKLAPFVDELLKENNILPTQLDAVAVSKGPGSYTGLRIGVSTAKGMAYALNIPLIGIHTLLSMAHGFLLQRPEYASGEYMLCPMIDARRMEVYTCFYSSLCAPLSEVIADIISEESYTEILNRNKVVFFGSGADKCKGTIIHKNAFFEDHFEPSSLFMAELSFQDYINGRFADTAYFEPYYLKDFVATIPRNKVLK